MISLEEIETLLGKKGHIKALLEEELKAAELVQETFKEVEKIQPMDNPKEQTEAKMNRAFVEYFKDHRDLVVYGKSFLLLDEKLDDIFGKARKDFSHRLKAWFLPGYAKHTFRVEDSFRKSVYYVLIGKIKEDALKEATPEEAEGQT
jgi:hypothetical protein